MNDSGIALPVPRGIESRTVKRIRRHLLPFLICLYLIAYIDRANIAYAALGMTADLAFDPAVIGLGSGIFFLGYFLLEIPGTLLVEVWSARKWIARIMISWGIVAVLMGFIQNSTQFYVARFFLGLAEAGFFPGAIVYLTHWFRDRDRVKAVSTFYIGVPVASIVGAPLAGFILGINWLGLAGWRWVFILEGIPAIAFGIATIFYLTDRPNEAKWLTDEERQWISAELERERQAKKSIREFSIWEAIKSRNVVLLTMAYFFGLTGYYGIAFWLPTVIKSLSGYSNLVVSLISMLPYCIGLLVMLMVGWSSYRTGEQRWHTAVSLIVLSIGLFLSAVTGGNIFLSLIMFCAACAVMYSFVPTFWSLPVMFLTESAAATSVGLINSVGNLGGFVGPFIVGYLTKATDSFYAGIIYLSLSALIAGFLVIMVHKPEVNMDSRSASR